MTPFDLVMSVLYNDYNIDTYYYTYTYIYREMPIIQLYASTVTATAVTAVQQTRYALT